LVAARLEGPEVIIHEVSLDDVVGDFMDDLTRRCSAACTGAADGMIRTRNAPSLDGTIRSTHMAALLRRKWRISEPVVAQTSGGSRVTAIVAGAPLWFESQDVVLRPSPEAFATLMFLPALITAARVVADSPLDEHWLTNTRKVPALLHDWWGYADAYPVLADRAGGAIPNRLQQRALLFSGGVDSMYEFLRSMHEIDALVFVHGFDIGIDDAHRASEFEKSVRRLAAQTGKRAVILRTNVRRHRVFRHFDWERTHGAALAAVGHVLSGEIGHLRVASSWSYAEPEPWGSRWDLDPLWSSGQLAVEHADASLTRQQKIATIASQPLAQQHLRVCWENLTAAGNCCRCTKCLRTMLSLKACGVLDRFETFERDVNIVARLDAVPSMSPKLRGRARAQLDELQKWPELRAALERLIDREPTRRSHPMRRLRTTLRRLLRG
jgi:hypothetical protein